MKTRDPDPRRAHRLVRSAIEDLGLDLRGEKVLTEAATGHFGLTAALASMAGAEVVAMARASRFGSVEQVEATLGRLETAWGLDPVTVVKDRADPRIDGATIVTNLGFVRPIDAGLVGRLSADAVVALMFEAWEFRPEDIDLAACRARGIPVAATNEDHPRLRIMDYVGQLAVRLLLDLDIEVVRSRVGVLGSGKFLEACIRQLAAAGADVFPVAPQGDWLTRHATALASADALVVAEHQDREPLLTVRGPRAVSRLGAVAPGIAIAHIAGGVEPDAIATAGLPHAPERMAPAGSMSLTTAALGPRPVIDLHAGGLRVAQELRHARRDGLGGAAAVAAAARASSLVEAIPAYR